MLDDEESREIGKITRTASTLAQKQLGDTYELVEAGDSATTNALMADLQVEDRLDARIDKLLKRLLFLRGLKSIPAASSSATPPRISSPTITTA
jgi:hypothetical protein